MTETLQKTNVQTLLQNYSEKEQTKIIEIGIEMFKYISKYKLNDTEIQQLIQNEKTTYNEKIKTLEGNYQTKLNQTISLMNQDKERLEQKLLTNNESSRDYWLKREENLRKEYLAMVEKVQTKYESTFLHSQNSTILGQDGETFTLQKLNILFPSSEIEDCHKETGRGDFILHHENIHMMIETKNYSKNVIKNEITKFYRDVDNNEDIQCAILVSLKSGICGKKDFHFEVRKKKPILFLHNISESITNLQLAVKFFKLLLDTKINLNQKEIIEKINNIIPILKRTFRKQKKQLLTFKKNMDVSINTLEQTIIELFQLIAVKY